MIKVCKRGHERTPENLRKRSCRVCESLREKDRYEKNKESEKLRTAEWAKKNPKKRNKKNSEWKRRNPEAIRALNLKRKSDKTKAGGFFTAEEWILLCFAAGFRCLCCGKVKKLTADHVIPIKLGGTSNIENIQPLCGHCNSSKGAKIVDYRV